VKIHVVELTVVLEAVLLSLPAGSSARTQTVSSPRQTYIAVLPVSSTSSTY